MNSSSTLLNMTLDGTARRNVTEAVCFYSDTMSTKVVRALIYCIIIVVSLLGNTEVVYVVYKNKTMRKTINFFIANMSIADLMVTICYMPRIISLAFAGYVWQVHGEFGLLFCKIACFNEVAILAAIFTIIAITVDRFLAVVFPLRREMITLPMSKGIIGCIWVAAIAAAFCEFYAIELREFRGQIYCYLDLDFFFGKGSSKAYFNFIIIGFFAIPFTTIIILYSGIITVLVKQRRIPGATSSVNYRQEEARNATRRKVLKMALVVVGTFVASWLLYFIHFIVYSYGITLPCEAMFMRLLLAHLHCAVSPFIYGFYNGNYRKGILSFIPSMRVTQATANTNNRSTQVQPARSKNNQQANNNMPESQASTTMSNASTSKEISKENLSEIQESSSHHKPQENNFDKTKENLAVINEGFEGDLQDTEM